MHSYIVDGGRRLKGSVTINASKNSAGKGNNLELFKLKKMGFKFKILKEYKARNGFNRLAERRQKARRLSMTGSMRIAPFITRNLTAWEQK